MAIKSIYKYIVPIGGEAEITHDGEPLAIDVQGETVVFWALVDPDAVDVTVRIYKVVPTGASISDNWKYVGTKQVTPYFVVHLFSKERFIGD